DREENIVLDAGLSIHGRVIDAVTKEPIAGADVGEVMWVLRSVHADAGGEYVYRGVRGQGPVALQARAKGYGPQTHIFRSSSNVDDLPDHYDFALSQGRRVRGRVVDSGGKAIADAYVAAVAYR